MHDLVAAQNIIKMATEVAKRNRLKSISTVTIKLGKIIEHNKEITPANLRFNFGLVKKNTLADKAKLVIQKGKERELLIVEVAGDK